MSQLELPGNFDWQCWIDRYDRMQERYLPFRSERFDVIVRVLDQSHLEPEQILDLGSGTGSLTLHLLEAFRDATVLGLEQDPTLIPLAQKRLQEFKDRSAVIQVDLRDPSWSDAIPHHADAAVSATALHWLSAGDLKSVYDRLAHVLREGGIFLNADHVGSELPTQQEAWERERDQCLSECGQGEADDWDEFWEAYLREVGGEKVQLIRQCAIGPWEGSEVGLSLERHFEMLQGSGFSFVECFWRHACDAVYGGIRRQSRAA